MSSLLAIDSADDLIRSVSELSSNASENDELEGSGEERPPAPTLVSSTLNVLNTILGTQMLSMAYAFAKIGPVTGTIILIIFALATRSSLRFLVQSAQQVSYHDTRLAVLTTANTPSYATLCRAAFGSSRSTNKAGSERSVTLIVMLVDVMMVFACLGFAVSYLQMIADGVPRIVWELVPGWDGSGEWIVGWISNGQFWLFAFLILLIPLSLSRDVDDFKWFSGTAFACAVYMALVVVICYFTHSAVPAEVTEPGNGPAAPTPPGDGNQSNRPWYLLNDDIVGTLPIFLFLFTCHQNIFSIYNELNTSPNSAENTAGTASPKTDASIMHIIDLAIFLCVVIYLAVGWAGYLTFGAKAEESLLNNLARISFVLLSAFSYPIQLHPCRAALDSILAYF
ncbi:transmembrane amino acid transporter protein-domain-containing protein, partial [Fimicolochytrium jonesii]|uniref:transmembrane amino acid transporter protein-domain-containing protein n=1 Tax=Fimicolochytrium jonesii TaxID=1396493 RepID=UPI0022FEE698